MASIYKRKSKDGKSSVWRAVVRIKGYPTVCKTSDRKQIVEDWTKETERGIKLGQYNFEAHNKNHTYAVTFDHPIWTNNDIESDVSGDLYQIAKSLPNLTREERSRLYESSFTFADLTSLVKKYGYSEVKKISARLMEIYTKENQRLEVEIGELEMQKQLNMAADSLNSGLGMIPSDESAEKVLKYERSIQKSIFQNLFLLKKLQGIF